MRISKAFFIVPISTTLVEAAAKPYNLVPLQTSNKTLFPNGFTTGYRPVLVAIDLGSDVRMSVLQLAASLIQGSITVPKRRPPWRWKVCSQPQRKELRWGH